MRTPRAKPLLLLRGEIEESQRQEPGAVADSAKHLAPAAKRDLGEQHLALDRRPLPGAQFSQGHDAGAILVAQGQQKQQILGGFHAQRAQPRRQARRRLRAAPSPVSGRSQGDDALHFDLRAARQRGNADCGARRVGLAKVFGHDLVDESEVRQDRSRRRWP